MWPHRWEPERVIISPSSLKTLLQLHPRYTYKLASLRNGWASQLFHLTEQARGIGSDAQGLVFARQRGRPPSQPNTDITQKRVGRSQAAVLGKEADT